MDVKSQSNNTGSKEKLLVLLGPTASGKTDLSIKLAQELDTEIISGDSMLVYRDFDIGSAKPTMEERGGIVHHMVDILPPDANFSMMDFLSQVKPIITRLNQEGKVPMLVGGTGLYIQSLLEGYELSQQQEDKAYRQYLEQLAEKRGKAYLHDMLMQVEPEAGKRLHVNDMRRIIRALEVHHLGGDTVSTTKAAEPVYDAYVAGLMWDRPVLYDRINRRVDLMQQQGLLAEIRRLLAEGVPSVCQAMKGIGYKELLPVITQADDAPAIAVALDKIRQNSRHFAKRQLTWYRRMPYIHWYQPSLYTSVDKLKENMLWDISPWLKNKI